MQITTAIIRDFLHWSSFGDQVTDHILSRSSYRTVCSLPGGEGLLSSDHVYVKDSAGQIDWDALTDRLTEPEKYLFIFTNTPAPERMEDFPFNAFFVEESSPLEVMEILYHKQSELSEWDHAMSEAHIRGASLQELVEMSEHVLKNPLLLLDGSMQILAASRNIAADDEHFHRTVALGYTPPEIMDQMVQKGYDVYSRYHSNETSIREEDSISPYAEVLRFVKRDGEIICGIVMHCSTVEETEGLIDVLIRFTEHLTRHFDERGGRTVNPNEANYSYESYFYHLLDGREIGEETVVSMSQAFQFPFEAGFRLFVLTELGVAPISYTLSRVMETIPDARCVRYEGAIVGITAFHSKYRKEEEYDAALYQTLDYLTKSLKCRCGVSRPFRNQLQMRTAYMQAKVAAEISARLTESKNLYNTFHLSKKPRYTLGFYDDLCLHHMALRASEDIPIEQLCLPELYNLLQYDKANHTDNYHILYIYLETNRKTTEAAKLLHMHRNNVTYRIKRIEELFGLDLEDPMMRLKVQYSFCVLDLL